MSEVKIYYCPTCGRKYTGHMSSDIRYRCICGDVVKEKGGSEIEEVKRSEINKALATLMVVCKCRDELMDLRLESADFLISELHKAMKKLFDENAAFKIAYDEMPSKYTFNLWRRRREF